jgi:uroporphyrin-III C-methyltransferase/precorrin-2 dehydrogenase/sirohydrochlorin ferrochelatase
VETPIYPLSLRLDGRLAVVVGGGSVALRRVAGLRAAGASVLVVAPRLSPALYDLAARGLIAAHERGYQPGDLHGAWLVLACTDDPGVNAAVAADAEQQRTWCVRADDAVASAAWVPAVGRSGPVTVAVNAGRDPRRAAALRDRCLDVVEAAERDPAERAAWAGPDDGSDLPRDGAWRLAAQATSSPRGVPGGRSLGQIPSRHPRYGRLEGTQP